MPWSLGDPSDTRSIDSYSPGSATAPGMAAGSVQLTLIVQGFSGGAVVVWLVQDNQPVIKASTAVVSAAGGAKKVSATFDLTGWSAAAGAQSFDVFVGEADLTDGAWADAQFELTGGGAA